MKSTRAVLFALIHVVVYCHLSLGQSSSKSNFAFSFAGYNRQSETFLCSPGGNTKGMIATALGESNPLEIPTTNKRKPHVQCEKNDPVMGNVVKFTIYKDDNDGNNVTLKDRQRMEMKGKKDGKKGDTFLYAWWFKLDSNMKNSDQFYHIFQIKSGGSKNLTKFALATLTLTKKHQLHLQLNNLNAEGKPSPKFSLEINQVKGKWIQAFVEAAYKKRSEGGYIRVTMKDENGKLLRDSTKIRHNMWWDNKSYPFRPKWGLYRKISPAYQPSDWQLFQNVQIWKKN
ncbi:Uncharacterized protein APZ42_021895 [Daphnia magna]|uniref:Uncharacterized protein n=1 Tax=Daphnia magna TaxID=35525 RepID=A0A0N8AF23_9CRUS|nr:Uncharacterized protein APZ42_021895 [Daphnia magna]